MPCVAEVVNRSLKADCTDFTVQQYRILSFKRHGVYLILGLLGAVFMAFISKTKIEKSEIMCQFKTIFL